MTILLMRGCGAMNDIKYGDYLDNFCYYDVKEKAIHLNYEQIKDNAIKRNKTITEMISRIINHETIHHVLMKHIDKITSLKFDNIARNYVKYWMW